MLRRLLSILLFWATLFPMIASALSVGAMGQSTLPACCRRGGKHHCMMSPEARALMMRELSGAIRVGTPPEQCPYRQHSLVAAHLRVFTPGAAAAHAAFLGWPSVTIIPADLEKSKIAMAAIFARLRYPSGPASSARHSSRDEGEVYVSHSFPATCPVCAPHAP